MHSGSMSVILDYSIPAPLNRKKRVKPSILPPSSYKSYNSKPRPVKEIKDSRDNKLLECFLKLDNQQQEFNLGFFKHLAELCSTNDFFFTYSRNNYYWIWVQLSCITI